MPLTSWEWIWFIFFMLRTISGLATIFFFLQIGKKIYIYMYLKAYDVPSTNLMFIFACDESLPV